MRWYINNNRLAYEKDGIVNYPSAEDIYLLSGNENTKRFAGGEPTLMDKLNIRFSRMSARIHISIEFIMGDNNIWIYLFAVKGNRCVQLNYRNGILPDSIVIDNSWYNLLRDHEEVTRLLHATGINNDGEISLHQYISLKRLLKSNGDIEIKDNAESALSNHLVKDRLDEVPVALKATLYPYQQLGYQWMKFITEEQCGCILGDEMGLGKTLQIITLIADRKQSGKIPFLIVAPVSLLENWKKEFDKFTEGLKVLIHHGPDRTGLYTELLVYDVVIISYNTVCSDLSLLKMIDWDLIVVDEAQNIKNPYANRTKTIKSIPRHEAIAVTGTPFENHISDIWSLIDFVAPGCLGKLSEFEKVFSDNIEGAKSLEPILSPIMIRRRVSDVAQDLPERIDVPQAIRMSEEEVVAYEKVREKILKDFNGVNASLPMLQKLRMYCTHPSLVDGRELKNPILTSGKYERMCELIEEISLLDEKVILFTSYNKMFDILQKDIPERFGIKVLSINGTTPTEERQHIIDRFSDIAGTALLILNPKAAGTGLNITAASRVIHYNLEWNPSLEDQASARAYRRGQTKTVFVYRLYYKDTVEEIINKRIEKKRDMFDSVVVGTDGTLENSKDIMKALMISPGGVKNGK